MRYQIYEAKSVKYDAQQRVGITKQVYMSPGKPWECRVFRGSLLWSGGNSFLFRPSIGAYSRAVTEEPNSGGCRRLALSRQNKKSLRALRL